MAIAGEAVTGTVVALYGGFCFVAPDGSSETVRCSLRGKIRLSGQRVLLVGDRVRVAKGKDGEVVESVLPRRSELLRPPIANIDLAIVVIAAANPEPNLLFADRVLVSIEHAGVTAAVCINKCDLAPPDTLPRLQLYFERAGYTTLTTSAKLGEGLDSLRNLLHDHTSTFAGPSGVGKSALLNTISASFDRTTGSLSQKLARGRHTTRHSELLALPSGGFVADTPGFTSLALSAVEPRDVAELFPEFHPLLGGCRFTGCLHDQEPDCAVKEAVADGRIDPERYQHYLLFLKEAKEQQLW